MKVVEADAVRPDGRWLASIVTRWVAPRICRADRGTSRWLAAPSVWGAAQQRAESADHLVSSSAPQ